MAKKMTKEEFWSLPKIRVGKGLKLKIDRIAKREDRRQLDVVNSLLKEGLAGLGY